ncbi:MAG: hypothetical protein JWM88_2536 [Verrucomicrobia bacterium]|nr:hypothetical protein [Verrucomicrobiota bacterium]
MAGVAALFALGIYRRAAALILFAGLIAGFSFVGLPRNFSTLNLGLILGVFAVVPNGEPWRLASGTDRPSEWFVPALVFRAAWLVLGLEYACSSVMKVRTPLWSEGAAWTVIALQISFLPLCLHRRGRQLAWTAMFVVQLGGFATVGSLSTRAGFLMLHLLTFDPDWFPPRRDARAPVLLYDGACGLCNAVVRFLLREDRGGRVRFAPLQSAPAQAFLRARRLPTRDFDSVVFVPDWNHPDGEAPRMRTDAVCAVLDEVGGVCRVLSWIRVIPSGWRDLAYRLVAKTRYAVFGAYRPRALPEPEWETRFLAR